MPGPQNELAWLLGQFYAEWDYTFDAWEDLVDDWAANSSAERRAAAAAQLDDLLRAAGSEDELDHELDRLGCEYYAAEDPGGYRGWLTAVRDRLVGGAN